MAKQPPETAFVVLQHQSNNPGKFVVVECSLIAKIDNFETPHCVCDTLDAAQRSVSKGRKRYKRNKYDSPQVIETWI